MDRQRKFATATQTQASKLCNLFHVPSLMLQLALQYLSKLIWYRFDKIMKFIIMNNNRKYYYENNMMDKIVMHTQFFAAVFQFQQCH